MSLSALPAAAAPQPQSATPAGYTYADCRDLDKEALRREIEARALAVLSDPSSPLNTDALVQRKWAELNVDAVIDSAVAAAVATVQSNESYWSRLWSGWSADKAEEFAKRIANEAFNSDAFKDKIDELSNAIGGEIARQIQAEFARAASAAFLCLQEFVGERYSQTLFTSFQEGVKLEASQAPITTTGTVQINAIDVHGKTLAGVGLIVVSEITQRVALRLSEKMAERIAGRIVARVVGKAGSSLIPVAGWVIGLGLIVWDLWEGGKGALPEIQQSLQSEEVKAKIRDEISTAIADGLPQEAAIAAVEISVSLVDEWNSFCDANRNLCQLSDERQDFRSILNYTPVNELARLSLLVDVFVEGLGRRALGEALDDGSFERLLALPPQAISILAFTRSTATTLAWADLAGERLPKLVEYGIHQRKTPADFDALSLGLLLDLDERSAITKLTALDTAPMQALLRLPSESLRSIAATAALDDMRWLGLYLSQPLPTPAAQIAQEIAQGKVSIAQLQGPTTPTAASALTMTPASGQTPSLTATASSTGAVAAQPSASWPPLVWAGLILAVLVAATAAGWAWRMSQRR
jgi:hypothetical protein